MSANLDVSSIEGEALTDLVAGQAVLVVDPATNRLAVLAKDSAGDSISTYLRSSKRFVANLTQAAGAAPVATILENDLGEVPVFARTSAGLYTCSTTTKFTAAKTMVRFGTPVPVDDLATVEAVLTSTSVITFKTKNYKTSDDSAGVLDGLLTNTVIVIEVFP